MNFHTEHVKEVQDECAIPVYPIEEYNNADILMTIAFVLCIPKRRKRLNWGEGERDILFSIIVPCFNVQDYLAECIESLLAQSYERFEILLIDDGPTDLSLVICDSYGKKDSRIKVFHKKNGGLSDARNFGLDRAEGDYIIFVDSDDYIDQNTLEAFEQILRNTHSEVLLTRLTDYNGAEGIHLRDQKWNFFQKRGCLQQCLDMGDNKNTIALAATKKILAKSFIDQFKLRFLKGYLHEDIHWN